MGCQQPVEAPQLAALFDAKGDNVSLDAAVATSCGWTGLENLVAMTVQLTDRITFDPLAHVMPGYHRFRRHGDMKQALVPTGTAQATPQLLAFPFEPEVWIADRRRRMAEGLGRLARATRDGTLPGGVIENGELRLERPGPDVPDGADELVPDPYRRLPDVRITDLLPGVNAATGFTDAFTHLRTGAPCKDRIGLLNVLLAEGLDPGLSKMAGASGTHDCLQLSRLSRRHVESEAIIIYWNTDHLGRSVAQRKRAGFSTPEKLPAHISPLGWAHILLTGEYRWGKW